MKYRFCYRTKEGVRFNTLFEFEGSNEGQVYFKALAMAKEHEWELKAIEQVQ